MGTASTPTDPPKLLLKTVPSHTAYYVAAKIGSQRQLLMLDSGCSKSLIPKTIFDQLPEHCCTPMTPIRQHGILANGDTIQFYGTTVLQIQLGTCTIQQPCIVADAQQHVLLGLDFFETQKCKLDFQHCKLFCGETRLQCCDEQGRALLTNVQLLKTTTIPPQSELLVTARVNIPWSHSTAIIEDNQRLKGIVIARAITQPKDQKVPLRLINVTDEQIQISAGQVLATCTTASQVETALPAGETSEKPFKQYVHEWCEKLPPSDREKGQQMLMKHQATFSQHKTDIGRTTVTKHDIQLIPGARPVKQRPYRQGPTQQAEIERQVQELQAQGLVQEGHGAWSSPVVLVQKKDGSWRFCVDYRRLNEVTVQDAYPLPRIDESLDALGGSKWFSTLDLTSGYWQVELEAQAKEKAAFATRSGLWEWQVLPFGLTCAPSTFERLMENVLRGLHWQTLLIYLDDIIVFSQDVEEHLTRLTEVFNRLQAAGLKLKPSKCDLFTERVNYLGHVITAQGIETAADKIAAVQEWPVPQHKTDVRSFLGTCGYYRRFIKGYSDIARPLSQISSARQTFSWTPECAQAFQTLKDKLTSAPILAYPDYKLPFILDTDASQVGIGAVLSQIQEGQERVIAYYSKMHSPEERNYCVTRQELLAIIKGVKHFRPHLYGKPFKVRTDHASLVWLLRNPNPSGQLARWIETLSVYQYSLEYRKGLVHSNVDGLSRTRCIACKQCQKWGMPNNEDFPPPSDAQTVWKLPPSSTETAPESDFPPLQPKHHHQPRAPRHQVDSLVVPSTLPPLAQRQQDDPVLGPVYRLVDRQIPLPDSLTLDRETKFLLERRGQLLIHEKVLCLQDKWRQRVTRVPILPQAERQAAIDEIHQQAHFGLAKTTVQLQQRYYWPGMRGEIRRRVKSCQACQQAKTTPHRHFHPQNHLHAGRPWQILAVDLCGPLPLTARGNTQILVIADHFTRWYDALPVPDGTAPTIAKILDERLFCYFGVPEVIHSDQGRQFESLLFQECCALWGCQKTRTAPYHPQGNSVVERLNRTLGNSLRALLLEHQTADWDEVLPQIMRTLRATPHRSTQETPNYLMLGREVRLPPDALAPAESEAMTVESYALQLQQRIQEAGQILRQLQKTTARTPDGEEVSKFQPGEQVWLRSFFQGQGRGAKLRPKYVGPYTVKRSLQHQTYEVERLGRSTIQHEGRIKRYVARQDQVAPPPEDTARPEDDPVEPKQELTEQGLGWYPEDELGPNLPLTEPCLDPPPITIVPTPVGLAPGPEGVMLPDLPIDIPGETVGPEDVLPEVDEPQVDPPRRRGTRERRPPPHLRDFEVSQASVCPLVRSMTLKKNDDVQSRSPTLGSTIQRLNSILAEGDEVNLNNSLDAEEPTIQTTTQPDTSHANEQLYEHSGGPEKGRGGEGELPYGKEISTEGAIRSNSSTRPNGSRGSIITDATSRAGVATEGPGAGFQRLVDGRTGAGHLSLRLGEVLRGFLAGGLLALFIGWSFSVWVEASLKWV